jgi:hypothetical protein
LRELNTLADLDSKARQLPRATDWLVYPWFMFARYRHLRPRRTPDSSTQRDSHLRACAKAFNQTLARWKKKIASHPEARRALQNLSPELGRQLAALLVDVMANLEMHRKKYPPGLKALTLEAPRRARMLKRKRSKVQQSLESWLSYAARLNPLLAYADLDAGKRCLEILGGVRERDYPALFESMRASQLVPEDPTVRAMVDLYWFFRYGCKLTGDESEVRVALLRNHFWTVHGVPKVEYLAEYRTGESMGCQAVHEAVRRSRLSQGT